MAAERLAYETTLHWHYRTIVLDFGQGWRKALNWPGMPGRVDIRQLHPGGVRPLRWNPLQIPKRVDPSRYRTLVCELFANAGRMGPRQLGFMRDRLTWLYQLTACCRWKKTRACWRRPGSENRADPDESRSQSMWRRCAVDETEEEVINASRREKGCRAQRDHARRALMHLAPFERQALVVYRSKSGRLAQWVAPAARRVRPRPHARPGQPLLPAGCAAAAGALAEGEMRPMYGQGYDTMAIEDLGLLGPGSMTRGA